MDMIRKRAEKEPIRLIIVTSDYHLPLTTWCFKEVRKFMRVNLEIETVGATAKPAPLFYGFSEWVFRMIFEYIIGIDNVIQETLFQEGGKEEF